MPPILENGFRPFFLGAALWLPAAIAVWVWSLVAAVPPPLAMDPLAWHRHETLFGGVGAILAGFLLTAVPNWTGSLPVRGRPLLLLFVPWAAARLSGLLFGGALPWLPAALELVFLFALWGLVAREIVTGRSWRNLPVLVLVGFFVLGAVLSWLEGLFGLPIGASGDRLGLAAIFLLIALIGGRIVPSFTRNWLARMGVQSLPAPFGRLDVATLALWALTLAAWVAGLPEAVLGPLFLAAGFLHAARLVRWQGHRTFAEPLVTVLHAGYAWLPVGAILYGLALRGIGLPPSDALHALTAGAIGTMTLAVMTRASLGHTGRELTADATTVVIYLMVVTGTMLRLLAPLTGDPLSWMALAGAFWGGAYMLFFVHYAPMLAAPRVDAAAGAAGRG